MLQYFGVGEIWNTALLEVLKDFGGRWNLNDSFTKAASIFGGWGEIQMTALLQMLQCFGGEEVGI